MSDSAPPPPPSEPTGGPGQTGSTGSTGPAGPPPGPPPTTPPNQPPAEQPAYQSTTGSSSKSGDEMKAAFAGAHKFDLAIMGAGVLMFIWSLLPYYTVSFDGGAGSGSVTAWHGFFGWFGALCALGAAILLVLPLLNVRMTIPTRQVVLGLLGFATLCVVIAFFVIPGGDCQGIQVCEDAIDFGHGVGYWLSLLTVIGATALAFMRKDAND
jgi:hypothetical protein